MRFVASTPAVRQASQFTSRHAEEFIKFLRTTPVAPNGHPHSAKRHLRDKGLKHIVEICRSMFNYARRHRHLPPYADNPFQAIPIDRLPIDDAKPIVLLSGEEERSFFSNCDPWCRVLFATMAMTGGRPGELTHTFLGDDLDLKEGVLRIRNKKGLGWTTKTRNELDIPLIGKLIDLLKPHVGERSSADGSDRSDVA
jgi:integrase